MLGRLLEDLAAHRRDGAMSPAMLAEAIRDIEINSPRVALPLRPRTTTSPVAPEAGIWTNRAVAAPMEREEPCVG